MLHEFHHSRCRTSFYVEIFALNLVEVLTFFSLGQKQYHLGRGHIGASMKGKLYGLLEHRAGPWYAVCSLYCLIRGQTFYCLVSLIFMKFFAAAIL